MDPCPRCTLGPCLEAVQSMLDTGHFLPEVVDSDKPVPSSHQASSLGTLEP